MIVTIPRCLLGTFSLLLVALAFAQLSIASLIYFKVFFASKSFLFQSQGGLFFTSESLLFCILQYIARPRIVTSPQQIDYGVVIGQMTSQTVREKYQVLSFLLIEYFYIF